MSGPVYHWLWREPHLISSSIFSLDASKERWADVVIMHHNTDQWLHDILPTRVAPVWSSSWVWKVSSVATLGRWSLWGPTNVSLTAAQQLLVLEHGLWRDPGALSLCYSCSHFHHNFCLQCLHLKVNPTEDETKKTAFMYIKWAQGQCISLREGNQTPLIT